MSIVSAHFRTPYSHSLAQFTKCECCLNHTEARSKKCQQMRSQGVMSSSLKCHVVATWSKAFLLERPPARGLPLRAPAAGCDCDGSYPAFDLSRKRFVPAAAGGAAAVYCILQPWSHISRLLEFIIEQDHRVNWVSGSLDSRVTGLLGHKMWHTHIHTNLDSAKIVKTNLRRRV